MARTSIEARAPFAVLAAVSALVAVATIGLATAARAHAPRFERPPEKAASSTVAAELAAVTKRYRAALEAKDLAGYRALHDDAVVAFQSGHRNVGWHDYEKNHLGPELEALKSFRFTEWMEASRIFESTGLVVADVSYVTETQDGTRADIKGVVTLVLRRTNDGAWRVIHSHWSIQHGK